MKTVLTFTLSFGRVQFQIMFLGGREDLQSLPGGDMVDGSPPASSSGSRVIWAGPEFGPTDTILNS